MRLFLAVFFTLATATACSKRAEDKAAPPPPTAPASSTTPGTPEAPSTGDQPKVDIPNEIVFEGNLLGGQPSPEALRAAAAAGYHTVINLQGEGEPGVTDERAEAKTLGLTYVSIPVQGPGGFTRENAEALDHALADAKGPSIVHCASGARVSGLYTLRAYYVQGKSVDDAIAEGKKAGLGRLEPLVRQVMAAAPRRP